ncbi:MAG: RHS repeat-associated core domain-containing protein [Blastocatellia bacterium]
MLKIIQLVLPITVIRTYDSRDKRKGDFGVGWTLDVKNIRLEKSSSLGKHWIETLDQEGFTFRYRLIQTRSKFVTITFPDGKVFKFKAVPNPSDQIAAIVNLNGMDFVPEPGTQGTLVALEEQELRVEGDVPQVPPGAGVVQIINLQGSTPGQPFNPRLFKLTTLEGAEFIIDEFNGLISIKDLNDNTLTVNNNGLVHSSGKSITFVRDSQGRITQITDPNSNSTSYTYSAAGDLVSVTNAENNTTSFTYNSNHYLLDITDARGIKAITNNYDSEGRLIQQIDSFSKITALEHNISAQREIIRDRLGNPTIIDYDDRGNITRNIDALGAQTTYTYDENDNLLTETNALGKTSTYTYDQFFNRLTEKDSLGNTTTYTYNNRQQILTITDPRGAITTNTYDLRGRLSTTKDALNNITQYTYNPGGLITAKTDAFGKVTNFEYNNFGLTTKITDPIGGQTTYTYDENGNPLTETSRRTINSNTELITTSHTYDKLNRLTRTTDADGNFTIREYNKIDMVSRTTDQNNNATTYIYDNRGQLSSITFADGKVQNSTYDVEGRRLTHTDRAGKVTRFTYDPVGRLIETLYPDQTKTIQTYDLIGRVLNSTDALNNTSSYEYDPNCGCSGRLTKVIDATGNFTLFAYDAVGNQISVTDANNHTTIYDYDLLNRNIAVRYFDNTQSTIQYDALGRRITQTDQNGKITRFQHDDVGRLVKIIDALNHETIFTYNELDQMLTQTDALGRTTRYEYNKLGNRTKRILPLGQQETYSYDVVGNLIQHVDFAGQVTTFTYNNLNQLIHREQPNGRRFTYTYTPMGQRSFVQDESIVDNTGIITYAYNQTDRLISKQTSNGTLTYTYDAVGNLLTIQSSNTEGVRVNYGYDSHNRLRTVTDLNLSVGITSYDYDLVGNLSKTTLPHGIESQYQYNALNFLTSINTKKDTASLLSFTYTLGAIGERLSVSELNGRTVQYNYDAIYRLTSESISNSSNQSNNGVANYNYDLVGNRLQRNSTIGTIPTQQFNYDNNDRLTSDTYDSNGNTIQSNNRSYAYNPDNKLVDVNDTNANLNIHIVYDADGNRFEKRVTQNNQTIVTKYLVDDISLTGYPQVVEEIVNNQVQRQYTYGLNLISQRQLINNERVLHFFLKDGHNSVRALTDINGNITDTYEYDSFGNTITSTGNTPNNYLYAGEEWDPDLGMFFLRARYMNPKTGRFITGDYIEGNQEDPLSLHRYLYASANPVYYVDPTGLAPISTVDAGVEAELNNILKANSTLQIAELYRIAALEVAVPAVTYSLRGAIIRSILAFGVFGLALATKGSSKKGSSPEVASKGGQQVERVGAKNDDYEDARGTIQIQGRDIAKDPPEYLSDGSLKSNPTLKYGASTSNGEGTVSWSWAQRVKKGECYPPAFLALTQLDALKDAISKQQVQRRQKGFVEAADYITSSQLAGGAPAGPTKSFPKNERDRDKKFPEARVDIKVYSGCAFHP